MHRNAGSRSCLALVAGIWIAACGGGSGTNTPDGGTAPGTGGNGGTSGTGGSSTLSHCPTDKPGPALARVRWSDGIAFCVDSTEVTNADYAKFLAANLKADSQPSVCSWNLSFLPAPVDTKMTNGPACPTFDPTNRSDRPVVCVDWCDADAYCRWAGKRLCGHPSGAAINNPTDPHGNEWLIACSGDKSDSTYPYGKDPTVGRCVDRRYPQPMPDVRPGKEATMCEGGVAGVFDMSGNAWEWTNDCDTLGSTSTVSNADTPCAPQGGSFSSDVLMASCLDTAPFHRKDVAGDTGFRCCANAEFF